MESIKFRRIPISCRYVPYDQWFVTHTEPSWKIKHLKQKILGRCHSISFDPSQIPVSEGGPSNTAARPPSPITFAPPRNSTSAPGDGDPEPGATGRDSPIRFAAVNTRNPLAIEGMGTGDELYTDDSDRVARSNTAGEKHGEHDDGYEEDNEWEEADGPGPGGRVAVPGNEIGITSTIVASPTISQSKGFNAFRIGTASSGGQVQVPNSSGLQGTATYTRHAPRPQIQTRAFTLVRFTTGQILEDEYLVSWYDIAPHELVELHFSVPPSDFSATIDIVPLIIFAPKTSEANGPGRGNKNKHRPTPSQSVNVLGIPAFDPTAMGFPPVAPNSSANPSQGLSNRGLPSVNNQRTLTSLPRSNPNAYIQPYWEGWVRALRVVVRPDIIETDSGRYNYGQVGSSLAVFGPYSAVPIIPKVQVGEERKQKSKLEWRERWVVIKDGTIYLCKDREDLEPTHRLPLSYLITLKGAEHLVQSISKGARGRQAASRAAASEKDGKTLRPPTTATSPPATRTTPLAPQPIDTSHPTRARGTSDAGLLSPTSRNKGKGRDTGDLKETNEVRDGRRRSTSPRAREMSNAGSANKGNEHNPGTSTIRPSRVDNAQGPSSPSVNRTFDATVDPKSRTAGGRQVMMQRPLTEAEMLKHRLEKEKKLKEWEEEKKRKQKEKEQLEAIMRWDDFTWGKKDKAKEAKDKEKERQKAKEKERDKKERKDREDERRRERDQLRSKSEMEKAKEREEMEMEMDRQKEREMEKEREKERERQREREREKEKERERERQRILAKRHDKTYIPVSTEDAELIGMKIVCAKFKISRTTQTKKSESDIPLGQKYTSTGPTLAGETPLPPHQPDLEGVKRDVPLDEAFLSQRKASLPHLGLNFLTTSSGPPSAHPNKEGGGGVVKFGIPGLFGKDKDKKDKKDKKRDDEDHHDDEEHHAATTGLGWKLGRKRKGGDIAGDFEVVSMPAVFERPTSGDVVGGSIPGPIGGLMSTVQNKESGLNPTEGSNTDTAPLSQLRVKPQRPAVVTTLPDPLAPIPPEVEPQTTDGEFPPGQLDSPTSDSMSLSSPVFAHSTDDEDSLDNDSLLGGPRKAWGERGDRKGYRFGGYHSSGPTKAREREKEQDGVENDTTVKHSVQLTTPSTTQSARPNQSSQPVQHISSAQPVPARLAPPPPETRQRSRQAATVQTPASSTSGRKKEDEKGEWIVLDMGSDHAFQSILRIFHRHFLPPISSAFAPSLGPPTTAEDTSVLSASVPESINRSANASRQTFETSAGSTGNDNSLNVVPSVSLAVPYPEWRLEILSKARTHGMREALRPLDLASRGCAQEDEDDDVGSVRRQSEVNVSSKAYAQLRRMSAQSRGVFSTSSRKRRSRSRAHKKVKRGKQHTKASHVTEGDAEGASLDERATRISITQEDTGSLADEDADVDEADEYDEDDDDDDDDDESVAPSQMEDNSFSAPVQSLTKRLENIDDGLFDASDADSRLAGQEDNVFSLTSFVDSDEESEMEWALWLSDIPRQSEVALQRKASERLKAHSNAMLRKASSSATLFSNPFGDTSDHKLPVDLHQDSWIPKIHAEEMRLVAEARRRLEPSAMGISRSSSEAYGRSFSTTSSTYHYGYPYYSETESHSPRQEKSLDSMRAQHSNYISDSSLYGSQPVGNKRDETHFNTVPSHQRHLSSSSTESLSITLYHNRLNATNIRRESPDSPIYDSPQRRHSQDFDEIPPVPPVPDEYLSQSPRSPSFAGASPTKSSTNTTPRHVRKHSRSLSGAIGTSYSAHPPLSPSSKQASGLYHSASFHTPTKNEASGLSSSRPDMPILSPEQISRIERETDEKMTFQPSGAPSIYASSSRGGLSVYDSYSASTGSRTANTSSLSVNNPYGQTAPPGYSQMFDGPPLRVKVEQATTTITSSALHASTSYPSMTNAARSSQLSTPSNPTSSAANALQSAGRGFVSLIHGNLIPRRSSSAGLLGKPNLAPAAPPQDGPSVTFANSPASSLGRSPSYRLKAQGMGEREKGPNVLRKRLSDLNRDRPPIPVMSASPPNPTFMSPRQRPKLSLPGIHNSPPPRDIVEPTSPRLQQVRSPTSTTMGINSPIEPSAGPWSSVDAAEQVHPIAVGAGQAPGPSSQSSNAMASARALLRRVRSGSSLHIPMGMHMEEPGSPDTPYGVSNLSRSP